MATTHNLRDTIIRIDQKLDDLMPRLVNIETSVEKQRELCVVKSDGYNRLLDSRVTSTMFRWTLGIIVTIMLGIASVTTATKLDLTDLQHKLSVIQAELPDATIIIDSTGK